MFLPFLEQNTLYQLDQLLQELPSTNGSYPYPTDGYGNGTARATADQRLPLPLRRQREEHGRLSNGRLNSYLASMGTTAQNGYNTSSTGIFAFNNSATACATSPTGRRTRSCLQREAGRHARPVHREQVWATAATASTATAIPLRSVLRRHPEPDPGRHGPDLRATVFVAEPYPHQQQLPHQQ